MLWGRSEDDQAAVVIATWRYLGSGYQSTGEAWLAASALPVPGSWLAPHLGPHAADAKTVSLVPILGSAAGR